MFILGFEAAIVSVLFDDYVVDYSQAHSLARSHPFTSQ